MEESSKCRLQGLVKLECDLTYWPVTAYILHSIKCNKVSGYKYGSAVRQKYDRHLYHSLTVYQVHFLLKFAQFTYMTGNKTAINQKT